MSTDFFYCWFNWIPYWVSYKILVEMPVLMFIEFPTEDFVELPSGGCVESSVGNPTEICFN